MPADNCGHFLYLVNIPCAKKVAGADGKLLSEVFMFLAFLLACGSLIGLIMFFGGGLF